MAHISVSAESPNGPSGHCGLCTYCSISPKEHLNTWLKNLFKHWGRDAGLDDLIGYVPELMVLILQKHHGSARLAVKWRGGVEDSVADNTPYLRILNLNIC